MKRNWTALALALGLTLTLTACGGNPGAAIMARLLPDAGGAFTSK